MRSVSVIVPARDAAATLPALLAALAAQDVAHELVVVDDGSTDATAALAAAAGALVVAGAGRGPALARNAGAAAASGEVLAFTDADCAPRPAWLSAALAALEGADLVQGTVGPPAAARVGPWDRTIYVSRPHGLFESANLVMTRGLFERLGGFESWLATETAIELGEDAWLGWRAVRGGARVAFAPDARVDHAVFPRGARAYVAERARLRFFPAMVARMPELRDVLCQRRLFLDARQAALVSVVRYPAVVRRDMGHRGRRVALVEVAADVVGLGALLVGSVRSRALLL